MTNAARTGAVDEAARERDARADWEARIYRRLTDTSSADATLALPAPTGLQARGAVGHIHLSWEPVEGAAGYLIERSDPDGETRLLQHGGADVPAVPSSPFADTGLDAGTDYTYRVAAVVGAEYPAFNWSESATAATTEGPAHPVTLAVDARRTTATLQRVWQMIGSERLSQLHLHDDGHGNDVGTEFAEALRIARADLRAEYVRAHAILHDDNNVVGRAVDGSLTFDFSVVDELYDQILGIGIRPIVELSFMPAVLARDPNETVFEYRGIISPPRDWSEWYQVVRALTAHLVDKYGLDEVRQWAFEVWNEPNLEVFWTGTQEDYLRLYDESARAVKDVDPSLRVGGPSTAASEWVEALTAHCEQAGTPLDFVTSHTYGNVPLDTRPSIDRHGFTGIPTWWTEWGVGSTHYGPIHDGVLGAPFALTGFHDVQGRMEAVSYWVISDHFEELGRGPRLFHNGFGLLSVGNLRKPRYWAAHLAAHQGDSVLATTLRGDGADVLVRAWATKHDDATIDVLVWNGAINGGLMDGDPSLARTVEIEVTGLDDGGYDATLARVDADHSNVVALCPADVDWPDDALWQRLRDADRLHEQPMSPLPAGGTTAHFSIPLPMPGVARVRITPSTTGNQKEGSR